MADLQILTTNENGDGWIDNVPGAVSTGYQIQNTNITARTLGGDSTSLSISGNIVTLAGGSGVVDVNGVPFVVLTEKVFLQAYFSEGVNFFTIEDGATNLLKSIGKSTLSPSWNPIKNYLETSTGLRVLNWVIVKDNGVVSIKRIEQPQNFANTARSGIGRGEERKLLPSSLTTQEETSHVVTIKDSGVYQIGLVSGGSYFTGSGVVAGRGGGGATCSLRLERGQRVSFSIGGGKMVSSVTIPSRLTLSSSGGSDGEQPGVFDIVGSPAEESAFYSGGLPSIKEVNTFPPGGNKLEAAGGGADWNGPGFPGQLIPFRFQDDDGSGIDYKMRDGVCRVGSYGRGGRALFGPGTTEKIPTAGVGIIKWLGE